MNIWLLNPYGPIPGEGWRDYRFTLLGRELARRGHTVTWWTANFSHHFKRYRSESWQDIPVSPGFTIRLVPTTSYTQNISLARVRFEVNYAWHIHQRANGLDGPDCIIGTDPSQIVGFLSVRLARRFHVPLILDLFDLWPELFVLAFPPALRALAPLVLAPLAWLRRHNLRRANAVTALCNTYLEMARRVAPNQHADTTLTIFNGINVTAFRALLPDAGGAAALAAQMGKRAGEVWAIYAGSLGNNYDIMTLLEAAVDLAGRQSGIKILIAGDGPLRPRVLEFIDNHKSSTLTYLGTLDHVDLIKLYGICDIGICAYAVESNVAMPDKAYDYMAAGLPIVNSLRGELEALLREHGAGMQYRAGSAQSLADVIDLIAGDETRRKTMASQSFALAARFDQNLQYGRFAVFIERLVSHSPTCIRPMIAADVPAAVQIHLRSFPGFFLTALGERFLRQLYLSTLADADGFGFVAASNSGISGFVAGTARPAGFYRRLLGQHWWRFAMASALPALRHPAFIRRLSRALSMPGRVTQQEGRGTLMSIAVLPHLQGQGIGQTLVSAFLEEAARRGLRQIDLTTDQVANAAANCFYQKLGFVCERTFTTPEGRVMNEYVSDVPTAPLIS